MGADDGGERGDEAATLNECTITAEGDGKGTGRSRGRTRCAADGVYEFQLVSTPLNLPAGVSSTANAVAVK